MAHVSQTSLLGLESQPYHAAQPGAFLGRWGVYSWLLHPDSVGILLNLNAETASRAPNSPNPSRNSLWHLCFVFLLQGTLSCFCFFGFVFFHPWGQILQCLVNESPRLTENICKQTLLWLAISSPGCGNTDLILLAWARNIVCLPSAPTPLSYIQMVQS